MDAGYIGSNFPRFTLHMPPFKQVDVFTSKKFKGNPVAVFFDADHLSSAEMSVISAWTNLSEATFVEKTTTPGADYKVRIFSLDEELPFAGHPTVGTCHALLEAGLIKPKNGKIVQECKAGLVELTVDDDGKIHFQLPYAKPRALAEQGGKIDEALGVSNSFAQAIYETGPVWLVVQLEDARQVLDLVPDWTQLTHISKDLGVAGFQVIGKHDERIYEARTFAPSVGEDPACGSGAGATGAFLRDIMKLTGDFTIRQGAALRRDAVISVTTGSEITVGGHAVTVINGDY